MILEVLPVGQLDANCYIIGCEETKEAAVIDPGGDAPDIIDLINSLGLNVKYIICTHGHADHVGGVDGVKNATGAKVLIHREDADMLTDPKKNLSAYIGHNLVLQPADQLVADGDTLKVGQLELEILNIPGHSRGGICIKVEDVVFSGDTLFARSIGRSDFPGGNHNDLIRGIKTKLLTLPGNTRVYPGHGPDTLVEYEQNHNPFLR